MLTIKDYDRRWYSSNLSGAGHPEGFYENKFISWWYAHFENNRNLYHVYVLYLVLHHNCRAEEYPGIDIEKIRELAASIGITRSTMKNGSKLSGNGYFRHTNGENPSGADAPR